MVNPLSLAGKSILITGGSSGIGKACAIHCSRMGANVILIARDEKKLDRTRAELKEGNHLTYSVNLSEYDKIESVISNAVSRLGKISGFIHCAGVELTLPLKNTRPGNYENLIGVNVIAGYEIAKFLSSKKYCSDQGASFIFIASIMGIVGEVGKIAYCSSKGALIAGARSMALELASKKIRVNCISPAMVNTEMATHLFSQISEESKSQILNQHPLGLGKPEDVAWAAIYLLSDISLWVTGTNLIIDGGYSSK